MFTLLEYVMRNAGMLLTRQMILEHVWDINTDPIHQYGGGTYPIPATQTR